MSRKKYVLDVTAAVLENPRAVLAGHGIPANLLKQIIERPDVVAKLALFAYQTKAGKRGARGLKKSPIFKITAYRNFPMFNDGAREDAENFRLNLPDGDDAIFTTSDNIITILALPDEATGDVTSDIANGKSVLLTFDNSVKKEYKIPGGWYITIMYGDSGLLNQTRRETKMKALINERKERRRLPAKVRAELKEKALRKKDAGLMKLEKTQARLSTEVSQYKNFGASLLGTDTGDMTPGEINAAIRKLNANNKRLVSKLSEEDKARFELAIKAYNNNRKDLAAKYLKGMSRDLKKLARTGILDSTDAVKLRKSQLRKEMKVIDDTLNALIERHEMYTEQGNAKGAADTRFAMRKWLKKYDALKASHGVLDDMSAKVIKKKIVLLGSIKNEIAQRISAGEAASDVIDSATDNMNTTEQMKLEVKAQLVDAIVKGSAPEYSAQQAVKQQAVIASEVVEGVSAQQLLLANIDDKLSVMEEQYYDDNLQDYDANRIEDIQAQLVTAEQEYQKQNFFTKAAKAIVKPFKRKPAALPVQQLNPQQQQWLAAQQGDTYNQGWRGQQLSAMRGEDAIDALATRKALAGSKSLNNTLGDVIDFI